MSDETVYINWYATKRHLFGTVQTYEKHPDRVISLCTINATYRTDIWPTSRDAERRKREWLKPKDYNKLPLCKKCERIAAKATEATV